MTSTRARYGLAMAVIFGIAFFIRVYFPYDNVFGSGWVRFHENDPWYQMQLVENLVRHFPHMSYFDPYTFFPSGQGLVVAPFFDLLLGFFIWVIGLGSPSKQVIETVGAYYPAVLGALVTVPVYFIGKELFNKKAGLLAAALIAILPGQFLWRSLLGFTDHHIAEVLFSALTMMFLILSLKSSKQKEVSFSSLWRRDWGTLRKPLIYSLLAGIALGCYLISWMGGSLLVLIIFVAAVIQYVMDHIRGRSTNYLCVVGLPCLVVALIMVVPFSGQYDTGTLQIASLVISILTFVALSALSFLMVSRNMRWFYYPLALVGLGGIGLALFYVVDPSLLESVWSGLHRFAPTGGALTIAEVKGLSLSSAWSQFTTGFYLALISLVLITYLVIKEGAADKTLLLIWSVIMVVATFGQNRFAYYFAVNVAILTAYFSWRILEFAGFKEASEEIKAEAVIKSERLERERGKAKPGKKTKRKKAKARKEERRALATKYLSWRYVYGVIAILVIFFLAYYPNIGTAIDRASADTGPPQDWHESLVWMRDNTPDPFQNPEFYYEVHRKPIAGEGYKYPESAYGVMSWWDYGRWITYMAHRIPNANPGQAGAPEAALFFTAQDESSANQMLDRLGSKYVVIDYSMATGKFYAMTLWAGELQSKFFEIYYQRAETGQLTPIWIYYPEYYQSMCSRLYLFGGEEWIPQETMIISWTEKEVTDVEGNMVRVKIISDEKSFSTYDDATAFVGANKGYRIAAIQTWEDYVLGKPPPLSPVPLAKLEHYNLVHKSPSTMFKLGNETTSYVEIFEYLR